MEDEMRTNYLRLAIATTSALTLGLAGGALAFHTGGVATCDSCHTMHNSTGGAAMKTTGGITQYNAGPSLLQGSTPSEACLNCHQNSADTTQKSYHVSTDTTVNAIPLQRTPGGDFGWLKATNAGVTFGGGHHINAPAYGYTAGTIATAPGSTAAYPTASLNCSSCHDPHGTYRRNLDGTISRGGKPIANSGSYSDSAAPTATASVGVYRLLAGKLYQPLSLSGTYGFANDPPAAVAPKTYNQTEATNQVRVAYGAGMSEWCANCHDQIINNAADIATTHRHPAGSAAKLGSFAANYNSYLVNGTAVTSSTSYSSLVPFEEGSTDYATLATHASNTNANLAGPDATSSQVSCLSCHRAHASAFKSGARFDVSTEFVVDGAGAYVASSGRTAAIMQAGYYDRSAATAFGANTRSLCNTCHAKS
jgi:hypothetical protein